MPSVAKKQSKKSQTTEIIPDSPVEPDVKTIITKVIEDYKTKLTSELHISILNTYEHIDKRDDMENRLYNLREKYFSEPIRDLNLMRGFNTFSSMSFKKNIDINFTFENLNETVLDTKIKKYNSAVYYIIKNKITNFVGYISNINIPIFLGFPNLCIGFLTYNLEFIDKSKLPDYITSCLNEYFSYLNTYILNDNEITDIKTQIIQNVLLNGYNSSIENISMEDIYKCLDNYTVSILTNIFASKSELDLSDPIYKNIIVNMHKRDSELFRRGMEFGTTAINALEKVLINNGYTLNVKTNNWIKKTQIIPNIIFYGGDAYKIENIEECTEYIRETIIKKIEFDLYNSMIKQCSNNNITLSGSNALSYLQIFIDGCHPNAAGGYKGSKKLLCQGDLKHLTMFQSVNTIDKDFPLFLNALEKMLESINFDSSYYSIDNSDIRDMLRRKAIKKLIKQTSTKQNKSYVDVETAEKIAKEITSWS